MNAQVRVTGVKETIRALNSLDKELVKQLKDDVNQVAAPVVNEVKGAYASAGLPLSGMAAKWRSKSGRALFPFSPVKVQNGIRIRFDTRRGAIGVIKVQQYAPAGAIFEAAGRKNGGNLSQSLDQSSGRGWVTSKPTRIIGPVTYKAARSRDVANEIIQVVDRAARTVEKRIDRVS